MKAEKQPKMLCEYKLLKKYNDYKFEIFWEDVAKVQL